MDNFSKVNKLFALLVCLLFVSFSFAKSIKNIDGKVIEIESKVQRVAALYTPSYEKIYLLDAEDKIVLCADLHKTAFPWSNLVYQNLEKVKSISSPHTNLNMETLLDEDLQAVFYWDKPKLLFQMKRMKIISVGNPFSSDFDDVKNLLMVYAQILGKKQVKIAQDYARYFDSRVEFVKSRTKNISQDKKEKIYFATQDIFWTAGKGTHLPEIVALAGGSYVSKGISGVVKSKVNVEQLIKMNPDMIFLDNVGSMEKVTPEEIVRRIYQNERLAQVSAIKNKQVYIVPTGTMFWDFGVQSILMLQWMAKILNPELFADFDMIGEVQKFYRQFFRYDLSREQAEKMLKHQNP